MLSNTFAVQVLDDELRNSCMGQRGVVDVGTDKYGQGGGGFILQFLRSSINDCKIHSIDI